MSRISPDLGGFAPMTGGGRLCRAPTRADPDSSGSPLPVAAGVCHSPGVTSDARPADVPPSFPPSDNPPVPGTVKLGDLLWTPSPERIADSNVTRYMAWLKDTRGLDFPGYPELWQWSITETGAFWQSV